MLSTASMSHFKIHVLTNIVICSGFAWQFLLGIKTFLTILRTQHTPYLIFISISFHILRLSSSYHTNKRPEGEILIHYKLHY